MSKPKAAPRALPQPATSSGNQVAAAAAICDSARSRCHVVRELTGTAVSSSTAHASTTVAG